MGLIIVEAILNLCSASHAPKVSDL